jgi:hypothetical protein
VSRFGFRGFGCQVLGLRSRLSAFEVLSCREGKFEGSLKKKALEREHKVPSTPFGCAFTPVGMTDFK